MSKDEVYLNYYQILVFLIQFSELKRKNPYFDDSIANKFSNESMDRMMEIAFYSKLKLFFQPNAGKVSISKSMHKYLVALTGIDPLEKKVIKEYIPLVKKLEKISIKSFNEKGKKQ